MMSKYQEKQKRKYEKTESGKISYAMWEHRRKIEDLRPDDPEIPLVDEFSISRDGYLSYCVSKPVPEKGNRYWFKIIPSFEDSIDKRIDILDTQPWYYL